MLRNVCRAVAALCLLRLAWCSQRRFMKSSDARGPRSRRRRCRRSFARSLFVPRPLATLVRRVDLTNDAKRRFGRLDTGEDPGGDVVRTLDAWRQRTSTSAGAAACERASRFAYLTDNPSGLLLTRAYPVSMPAACARRPGGGCPPFPRPPRGCLACCASADLSLTPEYSSEASVAFKRVLGGCQLDVALASRPCLPSFLSLAHRSYARGPLQRALRTDQLRTTPLARTRTPPTPCFRLSVLPARTCRPTLTTSSTLSRRRCAVLVPLQPAHTRRKRPRLTLLAHSLSRCRLASGHCLRESAHLVRRVPHDRHRLSRCAPGGTAGMPDLQSCRRRGLRRLHRWETHPRGLAGAYDGLDCSCAQLMRHSTRQYRCSRHAAGCEWVGSVGDEGNHRLHVRPSASPASRRYTYTALSYSRATTANSAAFRAG